MKKSRSKALASRAKYQEVPFGATEKIWTYDINCNCKDWKNWKFGKESHRLNWLKSLEFGKRLKALKKIA